MANNTIAVLRQMLASLDDAKKYQSLRDVMSTMNAPDLAAVFEDLPEEKMPVLFRLCPKDLAADVFAVLSSETQEALIRGLTDREPSPYSITVKTGYNPASLQADGIKVYTIKKELHDVGIATMNTPFGNPVPVYDMERTICDLLRSRSSMEIQTFQGALKMYARRKDKDLRTLMRYAGMFRVEKILRQYLEVLL